MTEPEDVTSPFGKAIRKVLEGRTPFSSGGLVAEGLLPGLGRIEIDPDECIIRFADARAGRMVCGRRGHPTETSDCAAKGWITHWSDTTP